MMNPYMITTRNQYYRFLTSGFIHRDHMHLLFNMFSFYFFGGAIEQVFKALFGDIGVVFTSFSFTCLQLSSPTYPHTLSTK